MGEHYVGNIHDLVDRKCVLVQAGSLNIGVFKIGDQLLAWENRCAHAGGPVCQGEVLGQLEYVMGPYQTVVAERFSEEAIGITCPWHGWEYDIKTGVCTTDSSFRLRGFETIVRGDDVYVLVDSMDEGGKA